ncbi:hypothetical protein YASMINEVIRUS_388 [Yasminevirus sp. GU-2018]|uniref:Uncharacterized protein n=1 Tax=Yasminevirus sp. GU-2018 TaxID=2420051 RepID=A0A5K0U803_9VIRU|nr:hypothetical protein YASMINEVIRUS_388 [Yasminevirus sp. GU-2018]
MTFKYYFMGKTERKDESIPFTDQTLLDRELIIRMLKYEDTLILGEVGDRIYKDPTYEVSKSLFSEFVIHRMVLSHFGFDTSDESVLNYRKIFKTYYKSPTDFDKEVMQSVAYMRNNRCVYYTEKDVNVGDTLEDCRLYDLAGNETTIRESLGEFKHAFVAGFSDS